MKNKIITVVILILVLFCVSATSKHKAILHRGAGAAALLAKPQASALPPLPPARKASLKPSVAQIVPSTNHIAPRTNFPVQFVATTNNALVKSNALWITFNPTNPLPTRLVAPVVGNSSYVPTNDGWTLLGIFPADGRTNTITVPIDLTKGQARIVATHLY